jgi:hypothetical protein
MSRKVVAKDGFRFSDGIVLPHGAYLSVAAQATHYDECNAFYFSSTVHCLIIFD